MDIIPLKNPEIDINLLIDEWLDYEVKANDASQNTIKAYRRSMLIFLDWLKIDIWFITSPHILEFRAELKEKYSIQTVNLYLSSIRSFYKFCVGKGIIAISPASEIRGIKRPKSKLHKRDALTNTEIKNILEQPDTNTLTGLRDKAILILMSHCALRSSDIRQANIEDLRTRMDRLTLDVQGKAREDKIEYVVIPVNQEEIVKDYYKERLKISKDGPLFISFSNRTKHKRIGASSIREIVKNYFSESGIIGNKKTTHSLRHSAITNAIRKGATPLQVQSMARHSSFDTTLGYYHEVARTDNPAEDLINYDE